MNFQLISIGQPYQIGPMVICVISLLLYLLIFCNFGDNVTTEFDHINETIYYFDWQSLPLELKKYLPLMMLLAQKPIYMRGLGRVQCTREMFGKVNF